jgi:hypothetical protein
VPLRQIPRSAGSSAQAGPGLLDRRTLRTDILVILPSATIEPSTGRACPAGGLRGAAADRR